MGGWNPKDIWQDTSDNLTNLGGDIQSNLSTLGSDVQKMGQKSIDFSMGNLSTLGSDIQKMGQKSIDFVKSGIVSDEEPITTTTETDTSQKAYAIDQTASQRRRRALQRGLMSTRRSTVDTTSGSVLSPELSGKIKLGQ